LPFRYLFVFKLAAMLEDYTLSYTTLFRSTRRKPRTSVRPRLRSVASGAPIATTCISERRAANMNDKLIQLNAEYAAAIGAPEATDRKSTRLNSSHVKNSYAVFCLKKKKII